MVYILHWRWGEWELKEIVGERVDSVTIPSSEREGATGRCWA